MTLDVDRLIAAGDEAEAKGDLSGACAHYREAVELAPRNARARLNLGVALEALGDAEGAIQCYEGALAIDSTNVYAAYNLGKLCYARGDVQRAEGLLLTALEYRPELAEARVVLSAVCEAQGKFETAAHLLEAVLKERPDWTGALLNYGNVLKTLGRLSEAEQVFSRVTELDPESTDAAYQLASLLQERGAFHDAERLLRFVVRKRPDFVQAHASLGVVRKSAGDLVEAESCFRRAVTLDPQYVGAHYLLGDALFNSGRRDEALAAFEKALMLRPDFFRARWARAMAQIPPVYIAESDIVSTRDAFAREMTELKSWLSQNSADSPQDAVGTIPPFYLAYTEENNRDLLALHGELSTQLMGQWAGTLGPVSTGRTDRSRIEIGVVSAHICDHSVWNAILKGWISHLDPERFSLSFFCLGSEWDRETEFARAHASHFEYGRKSLEDWVRSIRARQPHVLIYAEIGMDPIPLKLASLRLAPVQAATWGHPETTGLPTMDYYLSAEYLEPPGAEANYTESLVRLPGLGVCYEPLRIEPDMPDLAALGINRSRPVLISPGTPFKYSPRYDWVYARIAERVPDCQLVFFAGHKSELVEVLRTRLQRVFRAAGIDIERHVRFIPWLNRARFHGLMQHADVFLDPIGFSGFNTAIEAVEDGLPIVTRQGRYMRGRLASGILERMRIFELVAKSEQEYIELAVKLASDARYRDSMRSRIAEARAVLYGDIAPVRALGTFIEEVTAP